LILRRLLQLMQDLKISEKIEYRTFMSDIQTMKGSEFIRKLKKLARRREAPDCIAIAISVG
jgi:hypothetical protein